MIAISSPGFSMTPFLKMLDAISPHFDSWEIIAEGMHSMPEIEEDVRRMKESHDIHLAVHAPFSDLNIASLNPRIREESIAQVTDAMRISSDLDIEMITIHPGHKSPLGAYFAEKIRETNKESLVELDRAGKEFGVTLALENIQKMWISLCSDAQEMRELIEGTDLKICFDVGHANISGAIEEFLEMKEYIVNIHVHDNDGQKDKHMVLGKGTVDLKGILERLGGYRGNFVIEAVNLREGIESKGILSKMLQRM